MKTINQRINDDFEGVGFFTAFHNDYDDDYETLFGNANPLDLDILFLSMYGGLPCSPFFTNVVSIEQFTDIAYYINIDNWLKIASTLKTVYNVLQPYNVIETINNDRSYERENSNANNSTNSVFGFNDSSEAVPESTTGGTETNNETTSEQTDRTSTRAGNVRDSQAKLINGELALRTNIKFINIVMGDLKSLAGLDIYE